MKFYKRSLLSVIRQLGKTTILFLVTFVLALGIVLSFLIRSGIEDTKATMYNSMNLGAIVEIYSSEDNQEEIKKIYDKLAKSPYINYYDYTTSLWGVEFKDVKPYVNDKKNIEEEEGAIPTGFNITGVMNPELLYVYNKLAKISDGRSFTEAEIKDGKNVVIISKQIADANKLKVGQKISAGIYEEKIVAYDDENGGGFGSETTDKVLPYGELEIIGIIDMNIDKLPIDTSYFKDAKLNKKEQKEQIEFQKEMFLNSVYTPYKVIEGISKIRVDNIPKEDNEMAREMFSGSLYSRPLYIAKDVESLRLFEKEVKKEIKKLEAKGTDEIFYGGDVRTDLKMAQTSEQSIKAINSLAGIIFFVLIGLSVVVLGLVITLFLRDRRHEFGIYMALGEKKRKTVGQVLIETMLVGLVAFTFALAVSTIFADSISKSIITSTQPVASEEEGSYNPSIGNEIPGSGNATDKNFIANNYAVDVNVQTILYVYIIGFGTILIATIVPILYILRLDPKKILM